MMGLPQDEKAGSKKNETKPRLFRWVSLFMSFIATIVLIKDIVTTNKLRGASLAQADFGTFFDFFVFAVPSIIIVAICLFNYIRREIKYAPNVYALVKDPFIYLSILMILMPIIVYWIS
ncbi:hypothetical protein [Geotalea sp. SG265]|uniref:hypothetical protein n=1 Tax=Geotalea sp. SG265 TaxID=2922867 RepID=UPI001FAFEBEF|nr:hypothetical protein [Geotalea sp. SG265]